MPINILHRHPGQKQESILHRHPRQQRGACWMLGLRCVVLRSPGKCVVAVEDASMYLDGSAMLHVAASLWIAYQNLP